MASGYRICSHAVAATCAGLIVSACATTAVRNDNSDNSVASGQTAHSTSAQWSTTEVPVGDSSGLDACDIAEQAGVTAFLAQYISAGTIRQVYSGAGAGEETVCEYRWTPRLASDTDVDAPDDLIIRRTKYGNSAGGDDKDVTSVMATALRMVSRGSDDPLYPNFEGVVVPDIGAGAVFGVDEFYVAGSHEFYYVITLGNWTPNIAVMQSFQDMARAIANADK